jgi:hypothetical protein
VAAQRAQQLDRVAGPRDVVEVGRDLAVGQPFDQQLDAIE